MPLHYQFTGRVGVQRCFALLAQIPQTELWAKPLALTLKGIFQAYFNLVKKTTTVKQ